MLLYKILHFLQGLFIRNGINDKPLNKFYSSTPNAFRGFQVAEAGFSPRAIFF